MNSRRNFLPPAIIAAVAAASVVPAFAHLDANGNGVSDVWERAFNNGQVFSNFQPNADPDGDGWTNAQEALAGTDPFNPLSPSGMVKPVLTQNPSVPSLFSMSWRPVKGKISNLYVSSDMVNWTHFDSFTAPGGDLQIAIDASYEDGTRPDCLFWRVFMEDVDSSGKGLTDYELHALGIAPGFPDANNNNKPDDWEEATKGTVAVFPPVLFDKLAVDQVSADTLFIRNDTASSVNYSVQLTGNTGPAYSFEDSLTGSVPVVWESIADTGTLLNSIYVKDDASQTVALTNFSFPFYGQTFNAIHVCTNGFITLGDPSTAYGNKPLPSPEAPGNIIAAFWDDLTTSPSGTAHIYVQQETDRVIVQFDTVRRVASAGNLSFQIVLYPDGRIRFNYASLVAFKNLCTVGIQNASKTQGLQIVADANYLSSHMAIEIRPWSTYFTTTPVTGTIAPHTMASLPSMFKGSKLPPKAYYTEIAITHDGIGPSPQYVPARLEMINLPSNVELISPSNNSEVVDGEFIYLQAVATDPEGIASIEFYDGVTKIAELPVSATYAIPSYTPDLGEHQIIARAVDIYGATTTSNIVSVTVQGDSDGDGMPDYWEIRENLDPFDPADALLGDPSNLMRYRAERAAAAAVANTP